MSKEGLRLGLNHSVERIMSAGGDERIRIDERTGLNKYGCAPYPRNCLAYASSTASSIGASSFEYVNSIHYQLLEETKTLSELEIYERQFHKISKKLKSIYSLDNKIDIAFGPSGTDLELAVLAFALLSEQKGVNNIVIGINEVGSGAEYAASGQHFAEHTALDSIVEVGTMIQGFDDADISFSKVFIRNNSGTPRNSIEVFEELEGYISKAISEDVRPLIHVVHRSKTGLILPEWNEFKRLVQNWGKDIDIVIDACQGRISTNEVNKYLEYGATVLLTGSKFFGGAPFSGVALVPPNISRRLKKSKKLPSGLDTYFTRAEWPDDWTSADNVLPRKTNFGLLFRWESALYEMQRLMAVSTENLDKVIESFIRAAIDSFENNQHLKLDEGFDNFQNDQKQNSLTPLDKNTILTLVFDLKNEVDENINIEDARKIHRFLYKDLSKIYGKKNPQISSLICHLGQPVKSEKLVNGQWKGTLRLALSAPQVYELAFLDEDTIQNRFKIDFERISKKIKLIVQNFEKFNTKGVL